MTLSQERFRAGNAGTDEIPLPVLPQPIQRSGSTRTLASCWTDRPTIDAGGSNPDKHQPIETRIARLQGSIAYFSARDFHAGILSSAEVGVSRFSDTINMVRRDIDSIIQIAGNSIRRFRVAIFSFAERYPRISFKRSFVPVPSRFPSRQSVKGDS